MRVRYAFWDMKKLSDTIEALKIKDAVRELNRSDQCADRTEYRGPFGDIVCKGPYFFASKDGVLVGTYTSFREALLAVVSDGAKTS